MTRSAGILSACLFLSSVLSLRSPNATAARDWRTSPPTSTRSLNPPDPAQGISPQKGKFRDMVNGKEVGSEEFEISSDGGGWLARANVSVKGASGPETRITSQLQLRVDGSPIHYEWTTVTGSKKAGASVDFDNGVATIHVQVNGGAPFTQQFNFKTPLIAILDDNLYHQYAILADLYDWSKKGQQTFSVLIPQEMIPGTVTVEALDPENSNGKNLARLRVRSQDLEIILYLDGNRLERVSVPSANAEIVRQ
ncbi:MAG: hypothetical protein WAN10_16295 [Candidatus Acidiferrales bacterium]